MGRKRTLINTKAVSFQIDIDDWAFLMEAYPSVGAAGALRALARQHVSQLRQLKNRQEGLLSEMDLESVNVS